MLEGGYGRIINIASIAGKDGNPQASAYSASKAGVIGLTKSLGKELARQGIVVNCVTPAAVETDLFQQMSPEHIQLSLSRFMVHEASEERRPRASWWTVHGPAVLPARVLGSHQGDCGRVAAPRSTL